MLADPAILSRLRIVRLHYMHNSAPMDIFALLAAAGCMNLPSAAGVWRGMGLLQFQVGESAGAFPLVMVIRSANTSRRPSVSYSSSFHAHTRDALGAF